MIKVSSPHSNSFSKKPLEQELVDVLTKTLHSAQCLLDQEIMKEIYLRISKIDEGMSYLSVKFECLFDALLEQIELMKQGAEVQLDLEGTRQMHTERVKDTIEETKFAYDSLEEAMQKAEAEIRKHVRIEQQLKIYMDSLQERVQELEKSLATEQKKYALLFESVKGMDEQKKILIEDKQRLLKKLNKIEYQMNRETSKGSEVERLAVDVPFDQILASREKAKQASSKSRNAIERIHRQRSKKITDHKKKLRFLEGDICVNLRGDLSKKRSHDNCASHQQSHSVIEESDKISHNEQVKQLTKTVQMNHLEKRRVRRISKYCTESREEEKDRKDPRSSSVCS